MVTVAEVVAQTLAEYDTKLFFCVTGGDHGLWIALQDAGIRIINCRSEGAAVYMADGYARVTGKPGFVYGQKGPGAANVAAALADPYWAMSPVVSLTSATSLSARDRFEYQELDALALHAPLTRFCKSVVVPERTALLLRAAIRTATGTLPGPVHLEFPMDVLTADAGSQEVYAEADAMQVGDRRVAPDEVPLRRLVTRLLEAERPVIIAGAGVMSAGASDALTAFADALRVPVITTLGGKGSIAESHELAVGALGRYSRRVANDLVGEADVILAIGTRLGGLATNGWKLPLEKATLLQIDSDNSALGYNYAIGAGVLGDARLSLEAALSVATATAPRPDWTLWAKTVSAKVSQWRGRYEALTEVVPEDGIHPARVMSEVRKALGPQDLVASDTGSTAAWTGALFEASSGRHYLRSAGSLGWVVPGAMGAALAAPDRKTVAITGDGGVLYHIGDLETALRCDIPVVVVIMNNRAFASEYHSQKYHWHRTVPEVDDFYDVNYADVARSFGAFGRRVEDASDIGVALREALAADRPAVVEVLTSKETLSPSGNWDKMFNRAV